jgi:hypothetical protein
MLGIVCRRQVRTSGEKFEEAPLPMAPQQMLQLGVGRVAFGTFSSPRFLTNELTMPALSTKTSVPVPAAFERLAFQVWLPATPPPAGGYPVAIAGHGLTDNRFGLSSSLIPVFMQNGYAILSMNAVGHGFGSESSIQVALPTGAVEIPGGGRGIDVDSDGTIGPMEGCVTGLPSAMAVLRDCLRQTALDYLQLARAIRISVDLDGDGIVDLDPNRVGYIGHSLGGYYGTALAALGSNVNTFVFNSSGGSFSNLLTNSEYRPFLRNNLAYRMPSLLNAGADFDDNLPLRNEAVRVNDVPGAIAIQDFLSRLEWIETSGAPYSYAKYLSQSTLPGVTPKKVLFQYAWGDQTVPNPTETQLVRAANMGETTRFLGYDLLRAQDPALPENPHLFLLGITPPPALPAPVTPTQLVVAGAAQVQAVGFLGTAGEAIPDVTGAIPLVKPESLPEELNFPKPQPNGG